MSERHIPGIAILASGNGTTAEAFILATQDGIIDAEVGLVVCNNPPEKAGIYDRVAHLNNRYKLDIETIEINSRTHPGGNNGRGQTAEESAAICAKISASDFAHVALMGYMKVVTGDLLDLYGWRKDYTSIYTARMSNTHPGPLPETADTYGINASERVLQLGLETSKHTLHLVAKGVDRGPILAEHPVAVVNRDTPQDLFERMQVVEKAVLPYALGKFLMEQGQYYHGNT